jgi:hypothetical protein
MRDKKGKKILEKFNQLGWIRGFPSGGIVP